MKCWFCDSSLEQTSSSGKSFKCNTCKGPNKVNVLVDVMWVNFTLNDNKYQALWVQRYKIFRLFLLDEIDSKRIFELQLESITDINPENLIEKVSNYLTFI